MSKERVYFSHDADAMSDYKIIMLTSQLGMEGYGIFWGIIEMLRSQPEYRLPMGVIPGLANRFNVTQAKVEAVIKTYCLFHEEDGFFYSQSLCKRMMSMNERKQKFIEAGKRSAEIRKQKSIAAPKNKRSKVADNKNDEQCSSNVGTMLEQCSSNVGTMLERPCSNKIKENKINTSTKVDDVYGATDVAFEESPPTPKGPSLADFGEIKMMGLDELTMRLQSDSGWIRSLIEREGLLKKQGGRAEIMEIEISLVSKIGEFIAELRAQGKTSKTEQDAKQHFLNWFRKTRKYGTNTFKAGTGHLANDLAESFATGNSLASQISNSDVPV